MRKEWLEAQVTSDFRRLRIAAWGFVVEVEKDLRFSEDDREDEAWRAAGDALMRLLRDKYERSLL